MMKRRVNGQLVAISSEEEGVIRSRVIADGSSGPLLENHGAFDVVLSPEEAAIVRHQWATAPRLAPTKIIGGAEFIKRVTPEEYLAVRALERSNGQIALWMDEFRLNGTINVLGETALAAKAAFVSLGVCSQERADEIFG